MSQTVTTTTKRPARMVREAGLKTMGVPFSKSTVWRRVNSGDFPQPVKLSSKVTAWYEDEIEAWLEEFRQQRDQAA